MDGKEAQTARAQAAQQQSEDQDQQHVSGARGQSSIVNVHSFRQDHLGHVHSDRSAVLPHLSSINAHGLVVQSDAQPPEL